MTIADVIATVAVLALIGVGFPSLLLLTVTLFPANVARASSRIATTPKSAIATGLLTLLGALIVASVASNALAGPGKLIGVVALLLTLALASLGAAGLADRVARRMNRELETEPSPCEVFGAAAILELAIALPVVGWFVVLPLAFASSLGAGVLVVISRSALRSPAPTGGLENHA